ncbi:MAG: DinB family protein [Acidobacteriota bacterium]
MVRSAYLVPGIMLMASAAALGQGPGGAAGPVGVAAGLQRGYAQLKGNLTQSAEKMPEADYGFKPTGEIRSFGQLWGHVASAQFGQCSQAKGVANPSQGVDLETKTSKAEFVKALADSFAFCDDAFSALTDASAAEMIQGGRGPATARAIALTGVLTHGSEMYGIGTVYLRLKGLVPPSTENQGRRGGGGGGGNGGGGRGRAQQ